MERPVYLGAQLNLACYSIREASSWFLCRPQKFWIILDLFAALFSNTDRSFPRDTMSSCWSIRQPACLTFPLWSPFQGSLCSLALKPTVYFQALGSFVSIFTEDQEICLMYNGKYSRHYWGGVASDFTVTLLAYLPSANARLLLVIQLSLLQRRLLIRRC